MSTNGFTVVELVVVMVVAGILAGVLFGPLDSLYTSNANGLKTLLVTTDSHNALDAMQTTIAQSTGFLATNTVTDPTGMDSSTDGGNVLITNNYATTLNETQDSGGSRGLVLAADCSTIIQNNYVFFLNTASHTLYRRTLKNTTLTCTSPNTPNKQVQTCAAGSSNGACKGVDAQLASGVTSFSVHFYATPELSGINTTTPASAQTVVLSVTTSVGSGSQMISVTNNLRVSHLN